MSLTIRQFIEQLNALPEDVKDKKLAYIDFSYTDAIEIGVDKNDEVFISEIYATERTAP